MCPSDVFSRLSHVLTRACAVSGLAHICLRGGARLPAGAGWLTRDSLGDRAAGIRTIGGDGGSFHYTVNSGVALVASVPFVRVARHVPALGVPVLPAARGFVE